MHTPLVNNIFSIGHQDFEQTAIEIYKFQHAQNEVYNQWCSLLQSDLQIPASLHQIPFLPVSFFKSHRITSTLFDPEQIFESSGTTFTVNSKHLIKDLNLYRESFKKAFSMFYGEISDWCIIGLLPAYLERSNSSLVLMVDELIKHSKHPESGFYLYETQKLKSTLELLESKGQKTLLIGVTFALLDFAEQYTMNLKHTVIMETGGMKGRRKELTRFEVHDILKKNLGVVQIHSEYGMTELLSQAYSLGEGRFYCPPWMKVLVRDEEDPQLVSLSGSGILNVIDLANIFSCSFIATEDVGKVYEDGSFEVFGRADNSDIRGCSLLVV